MAKSGSLTTSIECHTDGNGYWTDKKKPVSIVRVVWETEDPDVEDGLPGETFVCAYFDPQTWNTHLDGLLYTDKRFLSELREGLLREADVGGLPGDLRWRDIDYTEQGMQGDDYVHLILGTW